VGSDRWFGEAITIGKRHVPSIPHELHTPWLPRHNTKIYSAAYSRRDRFLSHVCKHPGCQGDLALTSEPLTHNKVINLLVLPAMVTSDLDACSNMYIVQDVYTHAIALAYHSL
jgi:hypothetical protein